MEKASHGMKTAAMAVLVVILPIYQLLETRSATISLAISFAFFSVGMLIDHRNFTLRQHGQFTVSALRDRPHIAPLAGLSVYVLLSLVWTEDPGAGIVHAAGFAGGLIGLTIYLRGIRDWNVSVPPVLLLAVLGIVSVVLILEYSGVTRFHLLVPPNGIHDLNRSALYLTLLLWIAMLWPTSQKWVTLAKPLVFVLICIAVFVGSSETAKLSIILTTGLFLVLKISPRFLRYVLPFLAFYLLLFPVLAWSLSQIDFLTTGDFAESGAVGFRIALWTEYLPFILNKPIFGWGAEMHEWISQSGLMGAVPKNLYSLQRDFTPVHPHNLSLELWTDFGVVGIFLVASFLLLLNRSIKTENMFSVMLVLVCVASVIGSSFTVSVTQGWYLAQLATVSVIFTLSKYAADFKQNRKNQPN